MFLFPNSSPSGRGTVVDGGGGIPYSAPIPPLWGGEPSQTVEGVFHIPHPPRRFAPPLLGRGITPPLFLPFGEGNPQGGGGIPYSAPSPSLRATPPGEGNHTALIEWGITLDFSHVFDTL